MDMEAVRNGITIFFFSMTPFAESRVAIPYGIAMFGMSPIAAIVWGCAGNIAIVFLIMRFFDPITSWIFARSEFLKEKIEKYFKKLHTKHSERFYQFGAMLLVIMVATPIPGTGAWTGAILASLFAIPFWLGLGSISAGIVIAGVILAFVSKSAIHFFL